MVRAWSGNALMKWTNFTLPLVSMTTLTGMELKRRSVSIGSTRLRTLLYSFTHNGDVPPNVIPCIAAIC
jgi:hypothetical protein